MSLASAQSAHQRPLESALPLGSRVTGNRKPKAGQRDLEETVTFFSHGPPAASVQNIPDSLACP